MTCAMIAACALKGLLPCPMRVAYNSSSRYFASEEKQL